MLIRGTCQRKDVYNTIISAIATSGLWTQVSSNPTEDLNTTAAGWAGSDGNIFKSNFAKNGQYVYFAIKQVQDWASCITAGVNIRVNLLGGYTPGSAGANGTKSNYYTTGGYTWALKNMGTSLTTVFEYVVLIEAHRIIISIHQDGILTSASNVLYVGFADQATVIEGSSYVNAYLIPSAVEATPATVTNAGTCTPLMMKSPIKWGDAITSTYVAPLLDSITNPNYSNVYSVACVDIRYNNASAPLGYIGSLDGIYGLPATNINHLDILLIGSTQYLVVKGYVPSTINGFGCMWLAMRLT